MRTGSWKLAEVPLLELELKVRVVSASRLEWNFCVPTALLLTLEETGSSRGWKKKPGTVDSLFDEVPNLMSNSGLILLGFSTMWPSTAS